MSQKVYKYDVFISYAREDEAIVRSIHHDLTRSGLTVWEFKKNGIKGVDFQEEYKSRIEQSKYFCLIDSEHARNAPTVRDECNHAISLQESGQNGYPKFFICLTQKEDKWRKSSELFYRHNYRAWIDFNEQNYVNGIKELCKSLGVNYLFAPNVPRDEDFIEELLKIKMSFKRRTVVQYEDWERINYYYEKYQKNKYDSKKVERYILNIVDECRNNINIPLITPYLILGILYTDENRLSEAKSIYKEISKNKYYKSDPRIYFGLGNVYYRLKNPELAFNQYQKSIELILVSDNVIHHEQLIHVLNNLLEVATETSTLIDIKKILNKLQEDNLHRYEFWVVLGKIFLKENNFKAAKEHLETGLEVLKTLSVLNDEERSYLKSLMNELILCYEKLNLKYDISELFDNIQTKVSDDAEIFREAGKYYWMNYGHNERGQKEAINSYLKAIDILPDKLVYKTELASIYKVLGLFEEMRLLLKECFKLAEQKKIETDREVYYLGYAYFLDEQYNIAQYLYRKSKMNWDYYEKL